MEQLKPSVGENVCVEHKYAASLAKIIEVTRNTVRIRYESWMPHDTGEREFDLPIADLSSGNENVPWKAYRDRIVLPSPELLDAFLKKL